MLNNGLSKLHSGYETQLIIGLQPSGLIRR